LLFKPKNGKIRVPLNLLFERYLFMAYSSRFRGELKISSDKSYPEELVAAAKNTGFDLPSLDGLSKENVDKLKTKYSYFFNISATKIQSSHNDGRADDDLVHSLVKDITAAGAVVNGELIRLGEEQGDIERFTIKDNKIVTDTAILVWKSDKKKIPYNLYEL
jgi:hypothetical protein